MSSAPLSLRDGLLALAVMAVWGTNLVVIRLGLDHLPPLLFAALRFTLAVLPAIFFLERPPVPWRNLAAYGLLIGAGQFGLMFIAMSRYITPGLASLVIQLQAFFTIGLAAYLTGERVQRFQIVALLLAVAGIVVILMHTDAATTPLGLALVLIAALCWAGGNVVVRSTPRVNMLAYVVLRACSPRRRSTRSRSRSKAGRRSSTGSCMPISPPGAPFFIRRSPTRCSAMLFGGGCFRVIRLRPSRPYRCSFQCSAWVLRRYGSTNHCKAGSLPPPRSSWRGCASTCCGRGSQLYAGHARRLQPESGVLLNAERQPRG
jgi:hypothetical protein